VATTIYDDTLDLDETQPVLTQLELCASGITPTKKDKRHRCQFRFWIDAKKAGEYALGEYLVMLKQQRKYAGFMRDAIRLLKDLREGNTDVLLELFPYIEEAIEARLHRSAPVAVAVATPDAVSAQLARLERLMLAGGNMPIEAIGDVEITVSDSPTDRASADEIGYNMAMDCGDLFAD
jgi:hypothetical protein